MTVTAAHQIKFCLSDLERKDVAEQAAASLIKLVFDDTSRLRVSISLLLTGLRTCGNGGHSWRCKLAAQAVQANPAPSAQAIPFEWIIQQVAAQATDARPPSNVQCMQQLVGATLQSYRTRDENTPSQRKDAPGSLLQVLQPLIQACCSARGKRPHCDAAGELLATAIQSLPAAGHASSDARLAVLQQVASLLVQGTMPCDNVGSFRALRAGWAHLGTGVAADARVANSSVLVVLRALNSKKHWTVTAEAITALTALMLTVTEDNIDSSSSKAKSCIQKHGPKLQEALHTARYHQIKQCRAAAIEALAVLQALLPAELVQPAKQRQQSTSARPAEGQRRKGPWLHETAAAAADIPAGAEASCDSDAPKKKPVAARPTPSSQAVPRPKRRVPLVKHALANTGPRDFGIQVFAPPVPDPPVHIQAASPNEPTDQSLTVFLAPPAARPSAPLKPVQAVTTQPARHPETRQLHVSSMHTAPGGAPINQHHRDPLARSSPLRQSSSSASDMAQRHSSGPLAAEPSRAPAADACRQPAGPTQPEHGSISLGIPVTWPPAAAESGSAAAPWALHTWPPPQPPVCSDVAVPQPTGSGPLQPRSDGAVPGSEPGHSGSHAVQLRPGSAGHVVTAWDSEARMVSHGISQAEPGRPQVTAVASPGAWPPANDAAASLQRGISTSEHSQLPASQRFDAPAATHSGHQAQETAGGAFASEQWNARQGAVDGGCCRHQLASEATSYSAGCQAACHSTEHAQHAMRGELEHASGGPCISEPLAALLLDSDGEDDGDGSPAQPSAGPMRYAASQGGATEEGQREATLRHGPSMAEADGPRVLVASQAVPGAMGMELGEDAGSRVRHSDRGPAATLPLGPIAAIAHLPGQPHQAVTAFGRAAVVDAAVPAGAGDAGTVAASPLGVHAVEVHVAPPALPSPTLASLQQPTGLALAGIREPLSRASAPCSTVAAGSQLAPVNASTQTATGQPSAPLPAAVAAIEAAADVAAAPSVLPRGDVAAPAPDRSRPHRHTHPLLLPASPPGHPDIPRYPDSSLLSLSSTVDYTAAYSPAIEPRTQPASAQSPPDDDSPPPALPSVSPELPGPLITPSQHTCPPSSQPAASAAAAYDSDTGPFAVPAAAAAAAPAEHRSISHSLRETQQKLCALLEQARAALARSTRSAAQPQHGSAARASAPCAGARPPSNAVPRAPPCSHLSRSGSGPGPQRAAGAVSLPSSPCAHHTAELPAGSVWNNEPGTLRQRGHAWDGEYARCSGVPDRPVSAPPRSPSDAVSARAHPRSHCGHGGFCSAVLRTSGEPSNEPPAICGGERSRGEPSGHASIRSPPRLPPSTAQHRSSTARTPAASVAQPQLGPGSLCAGTCAAATASVAGGHQLGADCPAAGAAGGGAGGSAGSWGSWPASPGRAAQAASACWSQPPELQPGRPDSGARLCGGGAHGSCEQQQQHVRQRLWQLSGEQARHSTPAGVPRAAGQLSPTTGTRGGRGGQGSAASSAGGARQRDAPRPLPLHALLLSPEAPQPQHGGGRQGGAWQQRGLPHAPSVRFKLDEPSSDTGAAGDEAPGGHRARQAPRTGALEAILASGAPFSPG
eukprot:jgi/Ulvmu1/7961/UM004_0194.1